MKGKEFQGAWVPHAASKKFASLNEAMAYEMSLTKTRRTTWKNLIKGQNLIKVRTRLAHVASVATGSVDGTAAPDGAENGTPLEAESVPPATESKLGALYKKFVLTPQSRLGATANGSKQP